MDLSEWSKKEGELWVKYNSVTSNDCIIPLQQWTRNCASDKHPLSLDNLVSVCARPLQLCPTLWSSVTIAYQAPLSIWFPRTRILEKSQARTLEWVAVLSSRGSSQPRDRTCVSLISPALAGRFFTTSTTWEAQIIWHIFANILVILIWLYH